MHSYWSMLAPGRDGPSIAAELDRLEALGVRGVVAPQVYAPPFVALAAAAMANPRLELGSGIAIALTRSPFETACAALELDRISDGRFTLGLGVGPRHWVNYFGSDYDRPVARVREVMEIVRHVESDARQGVMTPFDGEFWQLEYESYEPFAPPLRERLPIYVAALRERVCELVGELGDGLIGHPVWSVEYALGTAQDALARGAARASRDPAAIDFQPYVTASIDTDEQRALDLAKPFIAFYAGFAQYHSYFDAHGFGAEAERLAQAARTQQCREAATLVSDDMARTFAACGTPDQVRAWIEPLWQRATSMVVMPPSWGLTPAEATEKQAAIDQFILAER
jgi:alkanesulfonate monooxygenase SsuD/methylene tetrahydromethanopterin reductase-like flavin-dependent oxidoreductase (luciferase family)